MELTGKKVLIVGLAKSGLAAIKVLYKCGVKDITLCERKPADQLEDLSEYGVKVVAQDDELFEQDFDLVIKNPGVPYVSKQIARLKERGIEVITEIELAYRLAKPQHYIAITGTNGKTTCTTLMYELLKKAYGDKALTGGNIGTPLCDLLLDYDLFNNEGYYIALEISNAQLVDIDQFRPEYSVIMNLTPDHIETMGSLDVYYWSKTLVYKNQKDNDVFMFNDDDQLVHEYTQKYPIGCQINTFSLEKQTTDAYLKDGYICYKGEKLLPLDCIKIVGMHNVQNIMVASTIAYKLGISPADIEDVISNFNGVEHRIEFVREINGVKYYNDSKGTNTDATITALKAFDRNVVLLVGGYEKGLDMEVMKPYLTPVKKVIGYGYCGPRLVHDLVGNDGIVVEDLPQAITEANKIAVSGDVVLLSPTTSSFDQYSCYEERGEHFKQIVNNL